MNVETYMAMGDGEREALLEGLSDAELVRLGVDLFNAREFWHSHEAWEAVWMDAPQSTRLLYQGLIQVAAAFVHVVRREYPGSVRLLEAGIEKLGRYPVDALGLDVGGLVVDARVAYGRIVALGERRLGEVEVGSLPVIRLLGGGEGGGAEVCGG